MSKVGGEMDEVDRRIVVRLRQNARIPITTLAQSVGISRRSAQERLHRLESRGVIAGYTVRLAKTEEKLMQAFLAVCLMPGHSCGSVVSELVERPEIARCFSLAGSIDMLLLVETPDQHRLGVLRDEISNLPGVQSVQTFPVLAEHMLGD